MKFTGYKKQQLQKQKPILTARQARRTQLETGNYLTTEWTLCARELSGTLDEVTGLHAETFLNSKWFSNFLVATVFFYFN